MTFEPLKSVDLPEMFDDEVDTLNLLLKQLHDKAARNYLRACYYDGKRAAKQVGTIIPPIYKKLALALGWSGKAVDALARRCNLEALTWDDGDLNDLGYRELWNGNHLRTEISSGVLSSLLHGTSFLVNTRGDESLGEPAALIHSRDAMHATGEWNARRRGLDNLVSVHSRDDKGQVTGFALYLWNLTITGEKDSSGWQVERQPHTWGMPAEPLVYKPRVGKPFGYSRISPVTMSMHDTGLRTLLRTEGHADVFSFPDMWLLGADESVFTNADGTQKAAWQVILGRIKAIPDDEDATQPRADVKRFDAASPQPHIELFTQQAKAFAGEHDIPVSTLGVMAETNSSTQDGSDNAERSLIAEAEGATDDWDPAIIKTTARALAMQNGLTEVPAEWISLDTKWRPHAYISRAAQADAGAKQLGSVPWLAETVVGLELIGMSEPQIKRALAERRRMSGSAALRAIADAAASGVSPVTGVPVEDAAAIKAKADAMGVLIRSGVDPISAANQVGFTGMRFTGAVPTSLRVPAGDADALEST